MANKMTKVGRLDNMVTYEHVCDAYEDLANIPKEYVNLGTIALILHGQSGGLEAYMADSAGEWVTILSGSSESGSSDVVTYEIEEDMEKSAYVIPAPWSQLNTEFNEEGKTIILQFANPDGTSVKHVVDSVLYNTESNKYTVSIGFGYFETDSESGYPETSA